MDLGETSGKSRTDLDLDHISRTLHRTLRKLYRTLHKLGGGHRRPTSKIDPSSPDLPVNYSQANKSYTLFRAALQPLWGQSAATRYRRLRLVEAREKSVGREGASCRIAGGEHRQMRGDAR